VRKNKKKGTAILTVNAPAAGSLALGGAKVAPQTGSSPAAGTAELKIAARGKGKKKLKQKGKLSVSFQVTFTPKSGAPSTVSGTTKLIKKKKKK
jgi:hypothetical protein